MTAATPQLDRLQTQCHRLRLYQVEAELPTLLEQAAKQEVSYAEFLEHILSREVRAKTDKHLAMRLAMARFPFQKTLESFDFKFQPSIDVKVLRDVATGRAPRASGKRIWPWPWASKPVSRGIACCSRPLWA